jgi:2,5-diketo-D-gluconate reductase A
VGRRAAATTIAAATIMEPIGRADVAPALARRRQPPLTSMTDRTMSQPFITLNDGHAMPQLGLGVFKVAREDASRVVTCALETGYRAIDTAAIYGNEDGVGAALAEASIPRGNIFVTTKLWNDSHAPERAEAAFETSLRKLGLAHVDLYLIHWPAPRSGDFLGAWKVLIKLRERGLARSIGVSNFTRDHLTRVIDATGIVPSVNQVELHPRFQQATLRAFHARHGIATQSWSPLGRGAALEDPVIASIARKHGKTPAQVILRWHLDLGLIAIPKSATPTRIAENFAVFDFALDSEDWAAIEKLDRADGRIGPAPEAFS